MEVWQSEGRQPAFTTPQNHEMEYDRSVVGAGWLAAGGPVPACVRDGPRTTVGVSRSE